MPKLTLTLGSETADVEVSRQGNTFRVTRDGTTAELHLIAQTPSGLLLEWLKPDGTRQRIRALGHASGDQRQLWVNGRFTTYERVRQRGAGRPAGGGLSSSIPAVVSQILVNVGDSVRAGDKLVLLESMKMVIPIQAPVDGVVTAVRCAAGDSVQANVPLIDLEENEP